ncbi:MAG: hypothetical protein N2C14_02550 [Planctomycetales bacterium]
MELEPWNVHACPSFKKKDNIAVAMVRREPTSGRVVITGSGRA